MSGKTYPWRPLVSTYDPERAITVVTRGMTSVEIPDKVVLLGPPGYVGWDSLFQEQRDRILINYVIKLLDEADASGQEEEGQSEST